MKKGYIAPLAMALIVLLIIFIIATLFPSFKLSVLRGLCNVFNGVDCVNGTYMPSPLVDCIHITFDCFNCYVQTSNTTIEELEECIKEDGTLKITEGNYQCSKILKYSIEKVGYGWQC